MFRTTKDYSGMTFGTITVDEFLGYAPLNGEGQRRFSHFKCHCSCGKEYDISGRALERITAPTISHSCSCPQIEYATLTGEKLHHLRLRYEGSRRFDVTFAEFCVLSLSPCFVCGVKPEYPSLCRLKKPRGTELCVPICDDCRQNIASKRS